jgi:hypothetical protein
MRGIFARSGIDLPEALAGRYTPRPRGAWSFRLGLGSKA